MSEEWPMRQAEHTPAIVARGLAEHPDRVAYVLLGEDDDWFVSDGAELDEDWDRNRELFESMCLHDVLDFLPQLTLLADLPAGMSADWDGEGETWLLSSATASGDSAKVRANREARAERWAYPGSPADEANVSIGLAEIGAAGAARTVRYVGREADGTWLFVGFEVPGPDETPEVEVDVLELGHVVELYPDVAELLGAQPGEAFSRAAPNAAWEQYRNRDGE